MFPVRCILCVQSVQRRGEEAVLLAIAKENGGEASTQLFI
jgi:hypothetical protein